MGCASSKGLSLKEAMILGTAGFTAALSVQKLEDNGLEQNQGPVLAAGSTGGVGSISENIIAKRGYGVVASTGKSNHEAYLKRLEAKQIINCYEIVEQIKRLFVKKNGPVPLTLWVRKHFSTY
ncbi:hypothetical protein ABES02_01785 [Neobacillus pocheonensis]|uniref:hypothetical protein n=1 Tax=Neobacillus pocheonensis TaxID=363869 RepID=UPI003D26A632